MNCFTYDTLLTAGLIATDGTADVECQALCDALDACFPCEMVAACSGHGDHPLTIWFMAQPEALWPLLACCDWLTHAGIPWTCTAVQSCDEWGMLWEVSSGGHGEHAAVAAGQLAVAVRVFVADERESESFI